MGDIKPANLLLSIDGELWLADFDAAAPADDTLLERSSLRSGFNPAAHIATDIVALAVTLVELSTGVVIDAGVKWRDGDLRNLGCPPTLASVTSLMLSKPRRRQERSQCGRTLRF